MACLQIRIISCPDRAHARGFVARVALSAVLEVTVRPPRAVHADVAGERDVGAAVGLAHHCNHSDLQQFIATEQNKIHNKTKREQNKTKTRKKNQLEAPSSLLRLFGAMINSS